MRQKLIGVKKRGNYCAVVVMTTAVVVDVAKERVARMRDDEESTGDEK